MKKSLIAVAVLVLVGIGAYYYLSIDETKTTVGGMTTYSNADIGIAFDYPAGPEGYMLEEAIMPTSDHLHHINLFHADDYQSVINPPVGGEGPPSIAINVFANSKNQFPRAWAEENILYSSFNLKQGEVAEAVVGGANAIRYQADGLYASEKVVVAHGGFVYVFTGMYLDADSDLKRDFGPIVGSVWFIPAPGQE